MHGRRGWQQRWNLPASAALLAVAVGYAGWTLRGVPTLPITAAAPLAAPTLAPNTALVSLMSPGSVQTDVQVAGVLSGGARSLALLSVNGATAQAYTAGERLGPSTRLVSLDARQVVLDVAGSRRTLAVPSLPEPDLDGLQWMATPRAR